MTSVAYHASHEQFAPSELLRLAVLAERVGFGALSSSDHFHPWSHAQGQSGFAWSWLGAALQATRLPATVVCAPGERYHPAIIAQAAATLAEMFPARFCLVIGSGEALNERITGAEWPEKAERNARLRECAQVIRALWRGETVTHQGRVRVREAHLFTRPAQAPQLFGAAISGETAEWMGEWVDGLVTISRPHDELREVVEAFRRGGGHGKPLFLKVQLSYAQSEGDALSGAWEQWRQNVLGHEVLGELWLPRQFEAAAEFVREEDLRRLVRISADPARHLEWLRADLELGFERLILHNVNRHQDVFLQAFGTHVLAPLLKT